MDGGGPDQTMIGCIVGRLLDPANNFYRLNAFCNTIFFIRFFVPCAGYPLIHRHPNFCSIIIFT